MLIALSDITIPDYRMRREFDPRYITELAADIFANGLQHPPVVRVDAGKFLLVSGERRLRAVTLLAAENKEYRHGRATIPAGSIPVTDFGELDELEALELELSENAIRVDLSWTEKAAALGKLEELHANCAAILGKRHTPSDTVREVMGTTFDSGSQAQQMRDMISISKQLHDPDVLGAKNVKEAKKILERKQRAILAEELGQRVSAQVTSHTLIKGDSFDQAPLLETASVDIILTDPPYGIDMDKNPEQSGSSSGNTHDYVDSFAYASDCVSLVANQGFRIAKANAHCYMFCDLEHFPAWRDIFSTAGWYVWPKPIIWNKTNAGSLVGDANGPRHCYETILFAKKGMKACKVANDVITTKAGDAELHPANKPQEVLRDLLSRSAIPGDTILDFFCGSGGVFPAATHFHCRAIGIERETHHAATAKLNLI